MEGWANPWPGWVRGGYWTWDLLHDSPLLYQLSYSGQIKDINQSFHECLYKNTYTVYSDSNPLAFILTTTKLDATGHCWVANLAT